MAYIWTTPAPADGMRTTTFQAFKLVDPANPDSEIAFTAEVPGGSGGVPDQFVSDLFAAGWQVRMDARRTYSSSMDTGPADAATDIQ